MKITEKGKREYIKDDYTKIQIIIPVLATNHRSRYKLQYEYTIEELPLNEDE